MNSIGFGTFSTALLEPRDGTKNKCRICLLNSKVSIDLFDNVPDSTTVPIQTYFHKLIACIPSLSISRTDLYPRCICIQCCQLLNQAYEFHLLCIESDEKLKHEVYVKIEPNQDDIPKPGPTAKYRRNPARYDKNGKKIRKKCEPKFKCTICDKLMSGRFALEQHIRIHTGERPFVCEICGKSFATRGCVKSHLELHDKSRIRKFKCNLCQYETSRSNHYKRHIIIHTDERPYECKICRKKYNNPSTLLTHTNNLHSLPSFKCDYCDNKFRTIGELRRHIVRHSGIYYECSECKNAYAKHKGLVDHLRRCHPGVKCPSKKTSGINNIK